MSDVCPLCNTPERKHAPSCSEGVPHREGYYRGIPVVADLPYPMDGLDMIKSVPEDEPNQWHVTREALEKLRSLDHLTPEP